MSRQLEGSIRRKSEARRLARKAKAERLAAQELARQEEVKRLKNLKRQELEAKLEQLKAVAGTRHEEGVRRVLELAEDEEEFDPEEYDAQMRAAFGDEYEAEEDEEMALRKGGDEEEEEEEGRPDFAKEDELLGLPKGWLDVGTKGFAEVRAKQLQGVPGEGESEEEDEGEEEEEEDAEAKTIKKKKGKIPLRDKLAFDQRLEEYYKMDYEDMIGVFPVPCPSHPLGSPKGHRAWCTGLQAAWHCRMYPWGGIAGCTPLVAYPCVWGFVSDHPRPLEY